MTALTRKNNKSCVISLIFLILLGTGCKPSPSLTPEISTSAPPGSSEKLPLEAAASPQPTVTPIPPIPGPQTITFANNKQTITLNTGQQFTLELDAGYTWTVTISDETILHVISQDVKGKGGVYSGLLETLQAGQAQLTAAGEPLCRQIKPPCGMPSLLFQLTVTVQ